MVYLWNCVLVEWGFRWVLCMDKVMFVFFRFRSSVFLGFWMGFLCSYIFYSVFFKDYIWIKPCWCRLNGGSFFYFCWVWFYWGFGWGLYVTVLLYLDKAVFGAIGMCFCYCYTWVWFSWVLRWVFVLPVAWNLQGNVGIVKLWVFVMSGNWFGLLEFRWYIGVVVFVPYYVWIRLYFAD